MKKTLISILCFCLAFSFFHLLPTPLAMAQDPAPSQNAPITIQGATGQVNFEEFNPKNAYQTCTTKVLKDELLGGAISGGVKRVQKEVNKQLENLNFPIPGTGKAVKNSIFGELLGISDDSPALAPPVRDDDTRKFTKSIALQDCLEDIARETLTTAANRFARRAMDSVVDGFVDWIQNGGEPRFLDLGTIYKEAADAAVGDALIEVGLGRFCSPLQKARLQIKLKQPQRFSERAQCTLTQVVDNLQDFYNDFQTGGWVAYYETLKPQNNRAGLDLMLEDELAARQDEEQRKKELEYTAAGGFRESSRCHAWHTVNADGEEVEIREGDILWKDVYLFSAPPYLEVDGVPTPGRWECLDREVDAPPGFVMGTTESVLTADTIHRTDPQSAAYAEAIGDAISIRAFKEGLNRLGLSQTGRKAKQDLETRGVRNPTVAQIQSQQIAEGRAEINAAKLAGADASEQAKELKKDVLVAFGEADAAEKLLIGFVDTKGNPFGAFKLIYDATGDLYSCQVAALPANNTCRLATTAERTDAENALIQLRGDRSSIQELRGHLSTIQTALEGAPSEKQVISFTESVITITDTLKALSEKYKTLQVTIGVRIPEVTAELALCRAPAYVCPR